MKLSRSRRTSGIALTAMLLLTAGCNTAAKTPEGGLTVTDARAIAKDGGRVVVGADEMNDVTGRVVTGRRRRHAGGLTTMRR